MATWNAVINADDDTTFTDLTWQQHLCNAFNQRMAVASGGIIAPINTTIAAGDDVQSSWWYAGFQDFISVSGGPDPGGGGPVSLGGGAAWIDTQNPVDATAGPVFWGQARLRTFLGFVNGTSRPHIPPVDDGYNLWRRKAPRIVYYPTDTTDIYGNTLSNGMIAWLLGSPRPPILCKLVGAITDPGSAPTLTPSATGGRLATGTYFVKYTYQNGIGETLSSPEANCTVTSPNSTGSILVTAGSLPTNAKIICVYVSTATGTETFNDTSPTHTCTILRMPFGGAAAPTVANASLNQTQWIAAGPTDTPDLLDSNNDPTTNNHVDPGLCSAGDYLTPQLLIELRAVLNQNVWVSQNLQGNPGPQNLGTVTIIDVSRLNFTISADVWILASSGANWTYNQTVGPGVGSVSATIPDGTYGAQAIVKYDGAGGFAELASSP